MMMVKNGSRVIVDDVLYPELDSARASHGVFVNIASHRALSFPWHYET
jgi:hypothetical protein